MQVGLNLFAGCITYYCSKLNALLGFCLNIYTCSFDSNLSFCNVHACKVSTISRFDCSRQALSRISRTAKWFQSSSAALSSLRQDDALRLAQAKPVLHEAAIASQRSRSYYFAGIRGIAAGCGPRLTELRLDELTSVTDEGLIALSSSCLNLQVGMSALLHYIEFHQKIVRYHQLLAPALNPDIS